MLKYWVESSCVLRQGRDMGSAPRLWCAHSFTCLQGDFLGIEKALVLLKLLYYNDNWSWTGRLSLHMCVQGIELRLSNLAASALSTEPSWQPLHFQRFNNTKVSNSNDSRSLVSFKCSQCGQCMPLIPALEDQELKAAALLAYVRPCRERKRGKQEEKDCEHT